MRSLKYEERRPLSDKLKPYVKCIWTLQRSYSGDDPGEVLWLRRLQGNHFSLRCYLSER